jgi:hypothetical protein
LALVAHLVELVLMEEKVPILFFQQLPQLAVVSVVEPMPQVMAVRVVQAVALVAL